MFGKIKYILKKNLNMKTSYVVGITVLSLFLVVGGISVALYTSQKESKGSLNIVTGDLYGMLESNDFVEGTKVNVGAEQEKTVEIKLTNTNKIDAKYNLYYTKIEGVEVEYNATEDIPPTRKGVIVNQGKNQTYSIVITNTTESEQKIEFGSNVGLSKKEVSFPEGKTEILKEVEPKVKMDDNMIPVVYNEKNASWEKASDDNWYNYDEQKWANAITINQNKALDISGNNNHGTLNNGVKIENGKATFNGEKEGMTMGLVGYDFGTTFTAILKVKINDYPTESRREGALKVGQLIHFGIPNGSFFVQTILTQDTNSFVVQYGTYYNGPDAHVPSYPIQLNKWYEFGIVCDELETRLYINGTLIGTAKKNSAWNLKTTSNILLGEYSNIDIEDVKLYKQILTEEDFRNSYNQTWSISNENLVAGYDFETGSKIPKGTLIPMEFIDTMWVYVPRYSYTIGSEDGVNYFGKQGEYLSTTPTKTLPGEIDVKFISKDKKDKGSAKYKVSDKVSGWYTPDAFTFGEKELSGVWLGKFETSSSNPSTSNGGDNVTDLDPMIKPNVTSWRNIQLANAEEVSVKMTQPGNRYGFSQKSDTHLTKNSEWALATYLSQSKYGKLGNSAYSGVNKEIYPNKDETYKTGCSYGQVTLEDTENVEYICYYPYDNIPSGTGASTTGTIYGIYDMSGGAWEETTGNYFVDGKHYTSLSGYKGYNQDSELIEGKDFLADKYYDFYKTDNPLTACNNGPCYGHGLNEVTSMYNDTHAILSNLHPWYVRSGAYNWPNTNGIFAYGYFNGTSGPNYSFRIALIEN